MYYEFYGMKLVENHNVPEIAPKIKLMEYLDISPEFRDEFNQWLEDRFGVFTPMYILNGEVLVAHPTTIHKIRESLEGLPKPSTPPRPILG